jgi:hypothetical protein
MGLLQEIRLMDNTHKKLELKVPTYSPLFLNVLQKRGHFLMEKSSLVNEMNICLLRTGKNFYIWLKENNLNIEETKNFFKLYV